VRQQGPEILKSKMTATERELRSRLAQLISSGAMIRATLTVRERTCGKTSCKCAAGEKHASLYLVSRQDGQLRQLFVPKDLETKVRQWAEQYQRVQELLEKISEFHWKRIQDREQ
jgi:hypothetical protein